MPLLADKLVEWEVVDAVGDETVRRALKTRSSGPLRFLIWEVLGQELD